MSLASLLHGIQWLLLLPVLFLLLLSFFAPSRPNTLIVMLLAEILLFGLTSLTGHTAIALTSGDEDSVARTSLGGGFWACAALCLLISSDAISRFTRNHSLRIVLNVQMILPVVVLFAYGQLAELSLLKEYDNRSDVFKDAV